VVAVVGVQPLVEGVFREGVGASRGQPNTHLSGNRVQAVNQELASGLILARSAIHGRAHGGNYTSQPAVVVFEE